LVSRRLYEILGLAVGFILIDYGFSFTAIGFPGARQMTSQFLGANLLVGGSALVFIALYYLMKPNAVQAPAVASPAGAPDVGIELVVEETPGPQVSFYRHIEYIGYFFTLLGLFSAADLVLQVLIPSLYDEGRWWVEVLLVTFGVLAYTIFGSVGRIGSQEEAKLASRPYPATAGQASITDAERPATPSYSEVLEVNLDQFPRSPSGEYEHHLAGNVYDMLRIESELITIWREDRQRIRSLYLAGPYELKRNLLQEHLARSEELRIGNLSLNVDTIRRLVALQSQPTERAVSNTV
jgi:hypothetical protein